jgi:hypothetical protein
MFDIWNTVHCHEEDLGMYVGGRTGAEHTSTVESHLVVCQTCRERLYQNIGCQIIFRPTGETKVKENYERSQPRFSVGDDAVFQEINPLSVDRHKIKIVDVSRDGLGILSPKSVFAGTIVQVRIKSTIELGEVRHCSTLGGRGYRIGLRLHIGF